MSRIWCVRSSRTVGPAAVGTGRRGSERHFRGLPGRHLGRLGGRSDGRRGTTDGGLGPGGEAGTGGYEVVAAVVVEVTVLVAEAAVAGIAARVTARTTGGVEYRSAVNVAVQRHGGTHGAHGGHFGDLNDAGNFRRGKAAHVTVERRILRRVCVRVCVLAMRLRRMQ